MGLSCSCDYDGYDFEPGDWQYFFCDNDLDFETFKEFRGKRCKSCGKLISYGDTCVRFGRYRYPYSTVEAKIEHDDEFFEMNYPPEIKMADHFQCESCGEIYLNLTELGFDCISPAENMPELLEEYKAEYLPHKGPLNTGIT